MAKEKTKAREKTESKKIDTQEIAEKAKKGLANLTGFQHPSAVGFRQEGDESIVTVEVMEKESIPTGMDILGTYDVRLDPNGKVVGYERTGLRKRSDTAFASKE